MTQNLTFWLLEEEIKRLKTRIDCLEEVRSVGYEIGKEITDDDIRRRGTDMEEQVAQREKEVPTELKKLQRAMKELNDKFGLLESNLASITSIIAVNAERETEPTDRKSELAKTIFGVRKEIEGFSCRVVTLLDQLEI